ncbi:MAG: GNAT family N-acetyltransferase [Kineosporiaceae bacterium]|nr:GNAT family N-acetyltransferase [Aeromicrobium sp.]
MSNFDFRVLRASVGEEAELWMRLVDDLPSAEVFAHPNYLRLFEDHAQVAVCAVGRSGDDLVMYPFLLRNIDRGQPQTGCDPAYNDIVTPYGYGGAFESGPAVPDVFAACFWQEFDRWAASHNVVSEFVRRSLFSDDLLAYPGLVEVKQLNVVRDLQPSEDELWMDFEHKVRKNVRRATNAGVSVTVDLPGHRLEDFLRIYRGTMDRREAGAGYYFSDEFFEQLISGLDGRFAFFHAMHEGRVVSSELALISRSTVYSFLGGTDTNFFALRPNDLLKFEIISWAKREGYSQFVLGGGFQDGDGIYKYKRAFAPRGSVPFEAGSRVLDEAACQRLIEGRQMNDPAWVARDDYFPTYRS